MKGLIATAADQRSAMLRRSRVLRNGLAVVSASALAASLIAAVPASAASTSADIQVTDSANTFFANQGQVVTYTATVTNLGTYDAQNVVMKTGGLFAGATAPGVSVFCASSSGISAVTTCTTPSLPVGKVVTIKVTRQVLWLGLNQCSQGDEAWATSDTFDPNLNNNTAYATVHHNTFYCNR
jgi:uncharacterized repeat protein (TIGR01451 family)